MVDVAIELLRQRIRKLAQDMVQLEAGAREAHAGRKWVRVGELHELREQTQQLRSELLREFWSHESPRPESSEGAAVTDGSRTT
jgi:hypothetical protein